MFLGGQEDTLKRRAFAPLELSSTSALNRGSPQYGAPWSMSIKGGQSTTHYLGFSGDEWDCPDLLGAS